VGQRVYPPPAVRAALTAVFGDGIEDVGVFENSWIARLHGRVAATTRFRRIYLREPSAIFFTDPELMLHEYCHVLLQWESGDLTTFRYLTEWVRNGYWNNRFEIEARRFADANLLRFRQLVSF